MCPVKAEYLRPAPERVSLDSAGRTRGMNKGAEREHSILVAGTERPTCEGESNFFSGQTINAIKKAIRECKNNPGYRNRNAEAAAKAQQEIGEKRPRESDTDVTASVNPDDGAESVKAAVGGAGEVMVEGTRLEEGDTRLPESDSFLRELQASQSERHRGLFTNKLILAPLTTVGNLPFRRICKGFGADITMGEMAVVFNLNRLQKSEWSLLRRHECEDIFGIQVAVSKPQEAKAFALGLEASGFSYDFLDINCGCPIDALTKNGCGCALWEKKGRLREVVQSLSSFQSRPVSIKCRTGLEENNPQLHRQIAEYQTWGAAAVTIHGRSRRQRYTRSANWDYIDTCATLANIPVIGNGDIMAWEDVAEHRAHHPHVSSFMIGRGALVKPWVFEEIKKGSVKDISSSERFDMLREFCRCGLAHWGADERGVMTTRRFLCEWLSFLCRYVPVALLERLPQRVGERPPYFQGRDYLETLMGSDSVADWIRISEMLLGPAGDNFRFTPKHKSNSYAAAGPGGGGGGDNDGGMEAEG